MHEITVGGGDQYAVVGNGGELVRDKASVIAKGTLAEIEKERIIEVLSVADSFIEAANILGINQSTLWRLRNRYGLEVARRGIRGPN